MKTRFYCRRRDGQIFESRDGGNSWTIIADVAPVSKGEFYRALVKDRTKLGNVDDVGSKRRSSKAI
jgi:hypothetical protein